MPNLRMRPDSPTTPPTSKPSATTAGTTTRCRAAQTPFIRRNKIRQPGGTLRAFTLIELLVVMSVIVILLAMFLVAFKYVKNAGARSTTKVSMDSLRGMLGAYDAASHLNRAPIMWNWFQASAGVPSGSTAVGTFSASIAINGSNADFWRYPFSTGVVTPTQWEALDTPGQVQTDLSSQTNLQRSASNAVLNTQLALQLMASVTENKSAFDQLPNGVKFYLPFVSGNVYTPSTTNIGLLNDDPSMPDSANTLIQYPQGTHVVYTDPSSHLTHYFVSVMQTSATPTVTPSSPETTPWYDETTAPRGVPVILDGWGNPIIFVPASGLHVRVLNTKSTL